jgi:putative ABC transport system ATP-binding protein
MSEEPLVSVRAVSKVYRQGKTEVKALDSVDLEIEPGDFAVLAGPSGSGKTTLLNMVGALDIPSEGEVLLEGRSLQQLSSAALSDLRLNKLGFVFQAYNLIPVLSAYENAEYVLLLRGASKAERREKVMQVLSDVGLSGLENRRPAELSGGQQQRVAIARALAPNPLLVLADEPTANLDSRTGAELVTLMRELNKTRKVTFLISSHDPKVIDRADRVITLLDGRVTDDQRREESAA